MRLRRSEAAETEGDHNTPFTSPPYHRDRLPARSSSGSSVDSTETIALVRDAVIVMLPIGGPVLLIALVVGLVVSLVQALDRKSTRLPSRHSCASRLPSSA